MPPDARRWDEEKTLTEGGVEVCKKKVAATEKVDSIVETIALTSDKRLFQVH